MSFANFLPVDYKAPKAAGHYMKIEDGENRVRILSAPIIGWEDWTADKKPLRFPFNEKPRAPLDPMKPIKHFWAFVVWNYREEKIQILQISQATVRAPLQALCADEDWGAPYFYDIKIIKKKEGDRVSYQVLSLPHKPTADHIREAFYAKRINLEALFTGEDPFAPCDNPTDGVFGPVPEPAEDIDRTTLRRQLDMCPAPVKEQIEAFMAKNKLKLDFSDMPDHVLDKIEKKIKSELELKLVENR